MRHRTAGGIRDPLEIICRFTPRLRVTWISWSRDGRTLTTGREDSRIITFLDAESGEVRRELVSPTATLYADWSHDDRFVAAIDGAQTRIWDWQRGTIVATIPDSGHLVAWHSTKPLLAVAT